MCKFAMQSVLLTKGISLAVICLLHRLSTRRAFGAATLHQRRMGGHMDENLWKGVYLALCSGLSETSQTLDTVSNIATVDDPGVIFTSISVSCQHELYLYET